MNSNWIHESRPSIGYSASYLELCLRLWAQLQCNPRLFGHFKSNLIRILCALRTYGVLTKARAGVIKVEDLSTQKKIQQIETQVIFFWQKFSLVLKINGTVTERLHNWRIPRPDMKTTAKQTHKRRRSWLHWVSVEVRSDHELKVYAMSWQTLKKCDQKWK